MFSPSGPSSRELVIQALSSVERGYDLLAPKFDHTPFRTPDGVLDATAGALRRLGPFERGLDVCCGTGAGTRALLPLCREGVTGVDFSAGMLEQARRARIEGALAEGERAEGALAEGALAEGARLEWVRADARMLPFGASFDLAVTFGALGHFLPAERLALFAGVRRALRPGGLFAFPIGGPPPIGSARYWALLGFDLAMRVRNALWRPPFVMYYGTGWLGAVRADLVAAGFTVTTVPLAALGRRADGSPRCRLVLARRP
ncbi:class I SAM-dependent methyltransferase [Nonomuraea sp. NPDC050783]|uniref:class I SAM-dependent methyltransferase n=1 Tax=Nonomuraea sp. NPDC050783 TaxID=3154634 RepID=UPI003466CF06